MALTPLIRLFGRPAGPSTIEKSTHRLLPDASGELLSPLLGKKL